jgi:hypothetical protein
VKYRTAGERKWHEGVTVSLSTSGAMIDGDVLPSRAQRIDVVIALPSAGGCLSGHGRIVSASAPQARAGHFSFAIAVPCYRIEHRAGARRRFDVLLQGC